MTISRISGTIKTEKPQEMARLVLSGKGLYSMADEKNLNETENEELEESPVYTLTDEETGEERDFELLAEGKIDDKLYFALAPADDPESEEYVILRVTEDGEDLVLESIEDDDEFEKAEDYFNDLFFSEVDYDEE